MLLKASFETIFKKYGWHPQQNGGRDELTKLGLHYAVMELGEMEVLENISAAQQEQFKVALLKSGLGLATTNEILHSRDVVVNVESALGEGQNLF